MKAIIRVPTKTQYAFIEAHVEGTAREIVEAYNELSEAYWDQKKGDGLDKKEFDSILDHYCWMNGSMSPDQYERMSPEQQTIIQTIKRSKKRTVYQAAKMDQEREGFIKKIT